MVWALVLRCVKTTIIPCSSRGGFGEKTSPLRFPHDFMAAYVLIFHLSKTFPGELHFNTTNPPLTSPSPCPSLSSCVILPLTYYNWPWGFLHISQLHICPGLKISSSNMCLSKCSENRYATNIITYIHIQ